MNTLRRRPGLRFLVEAVVIVITAVVTGMFHLGPLGIGGAVAIVWLVYVVIEYSLAHPREEKAPPEPVVETLPEPEVALPRSESVRVVAPRAEPLPVPEPEPEPVVTILEHEPEPEPEPVAVEGPEPVALEEPEPEPDPEPEPVPVEEPEPEPVDEPEAEEVSDTETVSETQPQQWNVWEIERALRASGESNEEREFLLIYLRDYAGPDGLLPLDFDELVRETFPDVVGTPTG